MRRSLIVEQDRAMLQRRNAFRMAADVVTGALARFEEVEAVALIGSVAGPLWKEVPRFREFRRAGVEIWHECKDVDLAVWLSTLERLADLRRARDRALHNSLAAGVGPCVTGHQVEVFLFEPGSDRYLGQLCNFSTCPKSKIECLVPGCGVIPFNKMVAGFSPHADLLAPAAEATLYRRGQGRLLSAADLPAPEEAAA